ncbi:MAG: hypothetical protein PUC98_05615 [Clostridiales bacterium]|nr:hypothetical protein [Clostridiales bacterium]
MNNKDISHRQAVTTMLLLLMLAVVSITAATAAWFSIASNTRLGSMGVNLTSGVSLRFDLDEHTEFDDYVKSLSFEDIADRILRDTGTDIRETPIEPVTTYDFEYYTYEDGTPADPAAGSYIEFVLHFMAQRDMFVHLTDDSGKNGEAGTILSSDTPGLVSSMRVSFTADQDTVVFVPDLGDTSYYDNAVRFMGLEVSEATGLNDNNTLFFIEEGVDMPVTVRIWIEGTDEDCTNDLIGSEYELSMRFEGSDENNASIEK